MNQKVEVEVGGKKYEVTYSVEGGMVNVSDGFSSKSTQQGGLAPQTVARLLGAELILASIQRGDIR